MAGVLYELYVKLGLDTKDFDQGIKDAKREGSTFGDVLKGSLASAAIQKGISTLTSGIKSAAGAFKNITTAAVSSYKDYEQLTGGVETLFKGSSKQVQKYAQDAYKTAGMSANQYMETVTGFSASLISSLDGDTAKAAKYADQAIQDMSDNANKMGTDISSIQTAYQGFAKQNYSMLDNLKLGYGGTQEEMYRLLQDAAKIDKAFASNAKFSMDSKGHLTANFADITKAIHIVQNEMDITGTTAKEAMTTIEGSANATKAAWQNVLTAIAGGGDIKTALKQLQDSIFGTKKGEGLLNQIIPRLKEVFKGIADFVAQAAPIIKEKLPKLLDELKPVLKSLMESVATIIKTLIPILVPIFIEIGKTFVTGVIEGLGDLGAVGQVIQHALSALIAVKFITGAGNLIKAISGIATAFSSVLKIIQPLAGNIGQLTGTLMNLASAGIGSVMSGISSIFTFLAAHPIALLVAGIIAIIVGLVIELIKNGDKVKKFFSDFGKFFSGIFDGMKKTAKSAVDGIAKWWSDMGKSIGQKASDLKSSISTKFNEMKFAVTESVREMGSKVSEKWGEIKSGISDIVGNIASSAREKWNDIKTTASDVWGKIGDFMRNPISKAKSGIEAAINAVRNVFSGLQEFAHGIGEAMKRIGDAIVAPIKAAYQVINSIMSGIRTVYNGIKNTASNIGRSLSNAVGNISSGLGFARHADAMGEGIIFDRLTTFGYSNGKIHQAGEAGQEALIGTKSLSNIIKNAVRNGMSGTAQGVTINVYGAQGQNINELADAVADRFQTMVDRRAAVWA